MVSRKLAASISRLVKEGRTVLKTESARPSETVVLIYRHTRRRNTVNTVATIRSTYLNTQNSAFCPRNYLFYASRVILAVMVLFLQTTLTS
jgi:hypothetical protein